MKKEVLLAIFIGLSVGLLITYGIYRSQTVNTTSQIDSLTGSPEPSNATQDNATLVIHSPQDESIVAEAKTTIAGGTTPQSFVIIFVNNREFLTTADGSGNFSISADLESGSNIITVTALDENGHKTTKELTVVFSTQPLTADVPAASSSAKPTAKPSPSVKPSPSSTSKTATKSATTR